ncbi:hypothetical protein ACHWQZ_G013517 [Mnemiopsis leidyi]
MSQIKKEIAECKEEHPFSISALLVNDKGGKTANPTSLADKNCDKQPPSTTFTNIYKMKMKSDPINLISQLRPLSQWEGQPTKESRKERRPRTVFTGSQLLALESVYQSQRLLCRCERARLAGALALTPAQVKVWFQNRRTKSRRDTSQTSVKGKG